MAAGPLLAALSGLTVASVFPLRRRAGLAHPYRLPLYPLPPLAYLLLTGWTVGYALSVPDRRAPATLGPLACARAVTGIPLSRLVTGRDRPAR